jgi:transcriptional regulator with XRE-family HTH domain
MNILLRLRSEKGWTLRELHEKTGLHINTIHLLETGQNNARGKTLFILAKVFEVDVNVLEPLLNQVQAPQSIAA